MEILTVKIAILQARYAKQCYNEYNDCKTLRILQVEANKSRYQVFDGGETTQEEYKFSDDQETLTSGGEEGTKLPQSLTERKIKEENTMTRSRLIINPDFVSTLDQSDGSKQYN